MYLLRMFREHEWGFSNKIIWFSHEIFNSKHDFLSERYHQLYRCLQGYRSKCKVVKYQFWLLILKLNNSNFTLLLVAVETNKKTFTVSFMWIDSDMRKWVTAFFWLTRPVHARIKSSLEVKNRERYSLFAHLISIKAQTLRQMCA